MREWSITGLTVGREKLKDSRRKKCLSCTLFIINPTRFVLGLNPFSAMWNRLPIAWAIIYIFRPFTVAARSKAWTVFAVCNAGIVGSNPTQGMDVCVLLFRVCVVLCVGSGLATGWSPVQGVLLTVYKIKKLKKAAEVQKIGLKSLRQIDRHE
jgi:hypothetical protein